MGGWFEFVYVAVKSICRTGEACLKRADSVPTMWQHKRYIEAQKTRVYALNWSCLQRNQRSMGPIVIFVCERAEDHGQSIYAQEQTEKCHPWLITMHYAHHYGGHFQEHDLSNYRPSHSWCLRPMRTVKWTKMVTHFLNYSRAEASPHRNSWHTPGKFNWKQEHRPIYSKTLLRESKWTHLDSKYAQH